MSNKTSGFAKVTRVTAGGDDPMMDPLSMFATSREEEPEQVASPPPSHPETFRMPNFSNIRSTQQLSSAANQVVNQASSMLSSIVSEYVGTASPTVEPIRAPSNNSYSSYSATSGNYSSGPYTQAMPSPITPPMSQGRQVPYNSSMGSVGAAHAVGNPLAPPPNLRGVPAPTAEPVENLLSGEALVMDLKDVYIHVGQKLVAGVLRMTTFRLKFITSQSHLALLISINPSALSWMNIPLACIDKIEKEKKLVKESVSRGTSFVIVCKDVRSIRFTVGSKGNGNDEYETDRALSTMAAYTFPNNIKYMFAFAHCLPSKPTYIHLLEPFELQVEYVRLGILDANQNTTGTSPWRICYANRDFRLCSTYGKSLIMPARMTDEELFAVAQFRSGQRLPVLCWGDKESGATMWRSSQPKCGMSGSCAYDERFLEFLAQSCAYQRTPLGQRRVTEAGAVLNIVDCRPKTSAMANRAAGAGYESQANYPNCRIDFYNIPNIHVMRDSYRNLMSIVVNTNNVSGDLSFSKSIEDTQWIYYCRLVIKAAYDTAVFIRKGQPVLVHCSHGWDRTAQVCSLSQLFLDSYYRTMEGFRVLVEKEWCAFGHPFAMRCQHGKDKANRQDDQWSPIFLQFLDCVYQILRQNKHFFEFNARYLVALADQVYACRFGTFLFDCDKEREIYRARECCVDVWTFLHYNRHQFLNPFFLDPNAEDTPTTHVLMPPLGQLMRNVVLWGDFFLRFGGLSSSIVAPEPLSKWLLDPNGTSLPSISTSEVQKIHPHYRITEDGTTTLNETSEPCPDLDISAIVTSEDFWEAAYREERHKRGELEEVIRSLCKEYHVNGYNEGAPLNELLKEMLHLHLQNSGGGAGHVGKHRSGSASAEDETDLLDDDEYGTGNNNNENGGGGASFPSPPPSPIADMEEEYEGSNNSGVNNPLLDNNGIEVAATPELLDQSTAFVEVDLSSTNSNAVAQSRTNEFFL